MYLGKYVTLTLLHTSTASWIPYFAPRYILQALLDHDVSQLEVPNHRGELPVFTLLEAFDDIDERVEMLEALCAYVPAVIVPIYAGPGIVAFLKANGLTFGAGATNDDILWAYGFSMGYQFFDTSCMVLWPHMILGS